MFPVFLNVRGRRGLVVGGGPVGVRRARALAEAGATVRLVSLGALPEQPIDVEWRPEAYRSDHLDEMSLVCAAATPEVNVRVVGDARVRGLWVNSATDPEGSDFVLPAVASRGRIQIAVSTAGSAPGLAARIRDRLIDVLDESVSGWVDLVADFRDEIRTHLPPERRAELLRRLAEPEWLDRIRTDGPDAVRQAMRAVVDRELGR